jgi:DNA polymerase III subunit delta'
MKEPPGASIRGQDAVRLRFREMIAHGRVAHAFLLVGKPGIGKRLLARELAQALNCEQRGYPPDGTCLSCRKIADRMHPDVIEVAAEGKTLKVDQVRELTAALRFRPYEGRTKVAILAETERMNAAAMNALLKTLEEPPPDTVLILTALSLESLLPTVISRCQVVRVQPLATAVVEEMLTERIQVERSEARLLAVLSEGSLGKALNLDREFFIEGRRQIISRFLALSADSPAAILDWAEELAKLREDPEEVVDVLATLYRDLLLAQTGLPAAVHADLVPAVQAAAGRSSPETIILGLERLERARRRLRQNANPRLVLAALTLALKGVPGARLESP